MKYIPYIVILKWNFRTIKDGGERLILVNILLDTVGDRFESLSYWGFSLFRFF